MTHDPVKAVGESRFFSAEWYLETYPDVTLAGMDPVQHYLHFGAPMERDPGPGFSSAFYLARHEDVRNAGHNPLWHYELFGRDEGREIAPSAVGQPRLDADIAASEIDRRRAAVPAATARRRIEALATRRVEGRTHRLLGHFDRDAARACVDALQSLSRFEMAARRRKASVILPSWNRAAQLQRAIASVLRQSHQNLELIVIDDGSDDATAGMLATIDDRRLRCLRTERLGVSGARNAGLDAARGDWIFYLDSDNRWSRDFVRLMLIGLEVTGARCGYASLRVEGGEGAVTGYRGEPFDRDVCLEGNYIDINVFCHRRSLVKALGGFDTALRRMVDWDLVLRLTRDNPPLHLPFIGCRYSDEKHGAGRVSTTEPYIFEKIVNEKNSRDHGSVAEALAAVKLDIAVKLGAGEVPEGVAELAQAFEAQGHRVRTDRPDSWTARHPHQDQLVLLGPGAGAYTPHPEQVTLDLPDVLEPSEAVAGQLLQEVRERVLAPGRRALSDG